jgi:hypothetical protein
LKHSIEELLAVVYLHYPRGIRGDDPRYHETDEHRRLVAARRAAGDDAEPWRAMLRRLGARFPECAAQNGSLHLPTGDYDAGYVGALFRNTPPQGEHSHNVAFVVSFLGPYYFVYSSRIVDDPEKLRALAGSSTFEFVNGVEVPAAKTQEKLRKQARRQVLSFDLSAADQPYAEWISREIETTFGGERMPPEIGNVLVPDVATNNRPLGEARLYDCLLSDEW